MSWMTEFANRTNKSGSRAASCSSTAMYAGYVLHHFIITAIEWRPAHIWHDVRQHARLRFPTGAAALRYNVLQKLSYCAVLFGLHSLPVRW